MKLKQVAIGSASGYKSVQIGRRVEQSLQFIEESTASTQCCSHVVAMSKPEFKLFELRGSYAKRIRRTIFVGRDYVLGSDPSCDIEITGEEVMARHLHLRATTNGFNVVPIEDAVVCVNGRRIHTLSTIRDRDLLALGAAQFQVLLEAHENTQSPGYLEATPNPPEERINRKAITTFGRSMLADCHVDAALAAGIHARLVRLNTDRYVIENCGAPLGTCLNGTYISRSAMLHPGDIVTLGGVALRFDGTRLLQTTGGYGVTIEATALITQAINTRARETAAVGVDLVVSAGEHLALVSSEPREALILMRTLAGRCPPVSGQMKINGFDYKVMFAAFAPRLGYVQSGGLYRRALGAEREVHFGALLRLPIDTTHREVQGQKLRALLQSQRMVETGKNDPEANCFRVMTALEILTAPAILFVEPPTDFSGFTGGEAGFYTKLAQLRTDRMGVVSVAADLVSARNCDVIGLLDGGQLVFFGPPSNAPAYFGVPDLESIPAALQHTRAGQLADAYKVSHYHEIYITKRRCPDQQINASATVAQCAVAGPRPSPQRSHPGTILLRRECESLKRDRYFLILAISHPLLLSYIVSSSLSLLPGNSYAALEGLTLGAIWLGLVTASHLILPTQWRLARECQLGLQPHTWALWQLPILLCMNALQSGLLLFGISHFHSLPAPVEIAWPVLTYVSTCAGTLGLTLYIYLRGWIQIAAVILLLMLVQVAAAHVPTLDSPLRTWAALIGVSYWGLSVLAAVVADSVLWSPIIKGLLALIVQGSLFFGLMIHALQRRYRPAYAEGQYIR